MTPVAVQQIPDGDAGARATAQEMARLIRYGSKLADVRSQARAIAGNAIDARSQVAALWRWVRDNVAYEFDDDATQTTNELLGIDLPPDTELVRSAEITLRDMRGDCDCQAVLLGSLIASLNAAPLAIMLAYADPARSDFSHVLLAAKIDGEWTPLETIIPGMPIGVLPDEIRGGELLPLDGTGLGWGFNPGKAIRDLGRKIDKARRNAQGELIDAAGNVVDAAGNVIKAVGKAGESVASQIARGVDPAQLIDAGGNVVETIIETPGAVVREAERAGKKIEETAKGLDDLIEVDWDGGAFGVLPKVKVDRRAATVIGGMLIGIPPVLTIPIAASPANAKLWEAKDKLNEASMRVFGAPILPSTIPGYMKQVAWVAEWVPLPGSLNAVLEEAAEAYEAGREIEHLHRAIRAMDDEKIMIEQGEDVLAPGETYQPVESSLQTTKAAAVGKPKRVPFAAIALAGAGAVGLWFLFR